MSLFGQVFWREGDLNRDLLAMAAMMAVRMAAEMRFLLDVASAMRGRHRGCDRTAVMVTPPTTAQHRASRRA
jgi:hypothetical protein